MEPVDKQKKEILLEDIPLFLKEFESPILSKVLLGVKNLKSEIESDRKNINKTILEFEGDDLNLDDVDKNLKTLVKRGKDGVVNTIKKETASEFSSIESYEDIIALNLEISQILKRMGDILGLHTRALHVFAKKYAEKLKEEITHLSQNRNLLQSLIDEYEKFRINSNNITELIRKTEGLKQEIAQKGKRYAEIKNEMEDTKKNIIILENDISELRSRKEYHEFFEIKKKIDSLSAERNEIKSKIDAQFSKISRPLSKYSYISSFDKPIKIIMEELVVDPHQTISSQNKEVIIEILKATTKSVLAGNVSVKDSEKSVQHIEETINRLDEFLMLKETFNKKLSSLESKLHIFDIKSLESKESDLQKAKTNLINLESVKKKIESEAEQNKEQVNNLLSQLQENLSRLSHMSVTIKTDPET